MWQWLPVSVQYVRKGSLNCWDIAHFHLEGVSLHYRVRSHAEEEFRLEWRKKIQRRKSISRPKSSACSLRMFTPVPDLWASAPPQLLRPTGRSITRTNIVWRSTNRVVQGNVQPRNQLFNVIIISQTLSREVCDIQKTCLLSINCLRKYLFKFILTKPPLLCLINVFLKSGKLIYK